MIKTALKHIFVPHKGNGYKPHIFHDSSIFFILVFVLIVFTSSFIFPFFLNQNSFLASVYSSVIIDLTNSDRAQDNLNVLQKNDLLTIAAQNKADDMASKSYFAHNSPSGITPWYWIKLAGYDFSYAGENLAIDFNDSQDVENAWMNSPEHRQNILSANYTDIGIGIAKGMYQGRETLFVAQEFGSKQWGTAQSKNLQAVSQSTEKNSTTTKVLGTSTSSKLSSQIFSQNLETVSSTPTYIEVKNIKAAAQQGHLTSASSENPALYKNALANPSRTSRIILISLAVLIIVSLSLFITVEFKAKHKKTLICAILLLVIIFCAIYIERIYFISDVLVV